ncbi:kinetochore protein, putative [Candida dubliniensis CD36]|uniref:Kinetochore protein Spc24 n=1 Tax=Candida dubliniensis (strain CD36 / ATCC MYA-646 / CBS 7987 / NCPF 3949 / NRRL Y-17841) TaxID=573826 RepID=B9WAL9_CANDC|nr:kinetochore protein, putative [Candida dubliniensis CD36]CAX43439.1 kinetochore protein, putative [Candida dubliniensis CD36]
MFQNQNQNQNKPHTHIKYLNPFDTSHFIPTPLVMASSVEKLNKLIEEVNNQDELQLIEEINLYIKTLYELRQIKIDQLSNIIHQLNQKIITSNKEINQLNKINDYNYELIKVNNFNFIDGSWSQSFQFTNFDRISSSISDTSHHHHHHDNNIFQMINKRLNELDNLKVIIVKELNDLETNLNNLKYKQNNLYESMEDINDKLDKLLNDIDKSGIIDQDPSILRINLFRNLGIKLENTPHNNNNNNNNTTRSDGDTDDCVIITDDNNNVNILNIEPKLSDYFISNYIWDKL